MADPQAPATPLCYIHPQRVAGSVCRRCNQPICPECMMEAPVGWQCPRCVRRGAKVSPTVRWRPGRLGNTRPTRVVMALVAINIVAYIWEQSNFANIVSRFGMLPYAVHHGQWYRLITAAFLHANFEHILFNMITLAVIGPPVEAELGGVRFVALYLVSALGGSVASYLLSNQLQYGVGASGAIFGLMGAYLVLARRRGWETTSILALIVINLVIGFSSSTIDWRAHIGGLVVGASVAFGLHRAADIRRAVTQGAEFALGAAVIAGAVVPLSLLVLLPPGHVNL